MRADAVGELWLEQNGAALAERCAAERELIRRRDSDYERALQAARTDPSEHLRDHLSDRPDNLAGRQEWDDAAAALLQYQRRFGELPGPAEPLDPGRNRAWRSLQRALERLDQHVSPLLGTDRAGELDRDDDLDLGPY